MDISSLEQARCVKITFPHGHDFVFPQHFYYLFCMVFFIEYDRILKPFWSFISFRNWKRVSTTDCSCLPLTAKPASFWKRSVDSASTPCPNPSDTSRYYHILFTFTSFHIVMLSTCLAYYNMQTRGYMTMPYIYFVERAAIFLFRKSTLFLSILTYL